MNLDEIIQQKTGVVLLDTNTVQNLINELCKLKTGTVILEPQNRLNFAITGYCVSTNQLVYNRDKLAQIFCDMWQDDDPCNDDDILMLAYDWIDYNCNVGCIID